MTKSKLKHILLPFHGGEAVIAGVVFVTYGLTLGWLPMIVGAIAGYVTLAVMAMLGIEPLYRIRFDRTRHHRSVNSSK